MFEMRNKFGNIYRTAGNIKERDRLLAQGYTVISGNSDEITTEEINTAAAEFSKGDSILFEKKTVGELKEYAQINGIAISPKDKKADIIEKIKSSI